MKEKLATHRKNRCYDDEANEKPKRIVVVFIISIVLLVIILRVEFKF